MATHHPWRVGFPQVLRKKDATPHAAWGGSPVSFPFAQVVPHRIRERNEMTHTALTTPILAVLTSAMALGSSGACAQAGTITFVGAITPPTCTLSTAGQDKVVPLGPVNARAFTKVGDTGEQQRFSLHLDGCSAPEPDHPQRASVSLSGIGTNPRSSNLHLMHAGQDATASGVEVRILDSQGEKLALAADAPVRRQASIDLRKGGGSLDFSAAYVAVALPVKAGRADAAIKFEVSYP